MCVHGETQLSVPSSARPEPHIRQIVSNVAKAATAVACSTLLTVAGAHARLEGVNKPELLPDSFTTVIDVAGFLTPGEEARIAKEVESLENDTGVKLRVLAQNYPTTPGLAVRDYWKVDDDTVVFVADPSLGGNILNFNVGGNIDLRIPRNFWTRLSSKYGTKYYWQERGEGSAIVNAVSAIDTCAREPVGRLQCSKIQGELGEEPSAGPIEKMFLGG
ncbi:g7962 [Coccomyxa elongata]